MLGAEADRVLELENETFAVACGSAAEGSLSGRELLGHLLASASGHVHLSDPVFDFFSSICHESVFAIERLRSGIRIGNPKGCCFA